MNISILFLILWVVSLGINRFLMTRAYRHKIDEKWETQTKIINWDWVFHPSLYDKEGKKLCRLGRVSFFFIIVFAILTVLSWGMS